MKLLKWLLIIFFLSGCIWGCLREMKQAFGAEWGKTRYVKWSDVEICNAIFKAEGGYEATYLYGIRSVSYKDEDEARRICLNTIKNHRIRHQSHECDWAFLGCLAQRYCPVEASNDPYGLNVNWLRNVLYFLKEARYGKLQTE